MIACVDWSGGGDGSGAGRGGGKRPRGPAKPEEAAGAAEPAGGAKSSKGAKGATSAKGAHGAAGPEGAKPRKAQKPGEPGGVQASTALARPDEELAPPMFVVAAGAPALEAHRPALSEAAVQEVFARKRAAREKRIAELVADAEKEGRPAERIVAAIIHDAEHAPCSTNRRQLAEIGVDCPPPGPVALSDAETNASLWRVIYGLARLGIFLTGTDHLDDRTFLRILCTRILEEEIRDVPPSRDMSEFIDLTPCRADHPDGLAGPFDAEEDEDSDADDLVRRGGKRIVARDALLPLPRRDAM